MLRIASSPYDIKEAATRRLQHHINGT